MANLKRYKGMILKTKEDEASRSRNNEDPGPGKGLARVAGCGAAAGGRHAATHGSSANPPIQTQSKQTVKEGDAAGRKISNTFDEVGQA